MSYHLVRTMSHSTQSRFRMAARAAAQRGVTLIELMVGVTIGLIAVVIITQVMVLASSQKRTTTSGSDAQVNGALALNLMQRDVRMGGYGFANNPVGLGCQVHGSFRNSANVLTQADAWTLAPVRITDGASGAPDSVRVMMSNSRSFAVPLVTAESHDKQGAKFRMVNDMRSVNSLGDVMLVIPGNFKTSNNPEQNWCSLFSLFPVPGTGTESELPHAPDAAASSAQAAWNPLDGNSVFPETGYPAQSLVINMGTFVNREYRVNANQLERVDFSSATGNFLTADVLFPDIVQLQAIYGKDTDGNGIVDTWNNTQPTTTAEWQQIVAVRLALVARSGQRERDEVTTAAPTWRPDIAQDPVDIVLTADSDWKYYRYKVYEALIPLRNVIWHAKGEEE